MTVQMSNRLFTDVSGPCTTVNCKGGTLTAGGLPGRAILVLPITLKEVTYRETISNIPAGTLSLGGQTGLTKGLVVLPGEAGPDRAWRARGLRRTWRRDNII